MISNKQIYITRPTAGLGTCLLHVCHVCVVTHCPSGFELRRWIAAGAIVSRIQIWIGDGTKVDYSAGILWSRLINYDTMSPCRLWSGLWNALDGGVLSTGVLCVPRNSKVHWFFPQPNVHRRSAEGPGAKIRQHLGQTLHCNRGKGGCRKNGRQGCQIS